MGASFVMAAGSFCNIGSFIATTVGDPDSMV
jgi:hypothetical protein